MKVLFAPIALAAGLAAGFAAQKVFQKLWALVDDQEPPQPEHRELDFRKLLAALAVEGAIFRLAKGLTDRGARRSFAALTGSWPGEETAERE